MSDSIKITLELADKAAQKALSDFVSKGESADKGLKKLNTTAKNTFDQMTVSIGKTLGVYDIFAGNLAANLLTKALDSIQNSLGNLTREATESEQTIENFNVALGSAGRYSAKTSSEFQALANQIQRTTKYTDDAVLASATLLLNLTNLSNEGIQQATKASVDLAATLNIDLQTATEMISKAVNGNTIAFSRLGIEIQKGDNDSARLTNTLDALANMQGRAAAVTNTYAGASARAANQQSELSEALGKLFTQSDGAIKKQQLLANVYQSAAEFITNNTQALRDFGSALAISAAIIGTAVAGYFAYNSIFVTTLLLHSSAIGIFGAVGVAASAMWTAITGPIGLAVAGITAVVGIVYTLIRNWDQVRIATLNTAAATLEYAAIAASAVSDTLAGKLRKKAEMYRLEVDAIYETIEASKNKEEIAKVQDAQEQERLNRTKQRAAELSETQKQLIKQNNDYVDSLAKKAVSVEQGYQHELDLLKAKNEQAEAMETEHDEINFAAKFLREEEYFALRQELLDEQKINEEARIEESTLSEETKSLARLESQRRFNVEYEKLETEKSKKIKKIRDDEQKFEEETRKQTLKATGDLLGALGNLAAQSGKEGFAAMKAFKTAEAIINAYAAITKTLSEPTLIYPSNLIAAAAIGIQAFANVSAIQSQSAPSFATGGIVPGSSFSGDNVVANVNSGEMVLTRTQQSRLFEIADGKASASGTTEALIGMVVQLREDFNRAFNQPIAVTVDGKEIFNITRNQLASGRTF